LREKDERKRGREHGQIEMMLSRIGTVWKLCDDDATGKKNRRGSCPANTRLLLYDSKTEFFDDGLGEILGDELSLRPERLTVEAVEIEERKGICPGGRL